MRRLLFSPWVLGAASVLSLIACGTTDPLPGRLEERLKALVQSGREDLSHDEVQQALARQMWVAPESHPALPSRESLVEFYRANGHRLVWSNEAGELADAAGTFLEALRRAGEHGLNPTDYLLDRLGRLASEIGKGSLADFDLLMTSAFFRYASDLSTGRVHPDEIRSEWHTNPPELDVVTKLGDALASGALQQLLESLPPPHAAYARLREKLSGLRNVVSAGGWPTIPDGPKLESGSIDPRVEILRQRLGAPAEDARDRFDAPLADAVREFQSRHGIEPDGAGQRWICSRSSGFELT